MKKLLFAITVLCASTNIFAAQNPMFDANDINSITIHIAQSTGSGHIGKLAWVPDWDFSPQTFFMLSYAQPMNILRMPGRINISAIQNFGYESGRGLSFFGMGASWDIAPLQYRGFYAGVGIGPYYRNHRDRWVSSRLFFGAKIFIGKNISEHWRGELFTVHFSNGDFTPVNHGFNFVGIGVNYGF